MTDVNPPPEARLLEAHESHHRGNILLTSRECCHNLDQATRHKIWSWDQI